MEVNDHIYELTPGGSFATGHIPKGFKKETIECADECDKDNQCRAFNHRTFNKACVIYHFLDKKIHEWGDSCTYIRSSSMYPICTSQCFILITKMIIISISYIEFS